MTYIKVVKEGGIIMDAILNFIKDIAFEHPEKTAYYISYVLGAIVVLMGRRFNLKLDLDKKVKGFELVKQIALEVVAGIYQRREDILGKALVDGKLDKNDGKLLMQEALKELREALQAHGFNKLALVSDAKLQKILESALSFFKMIKKGVAEKK